MPRKRMSPRLDDMAPDVRAEFTRILSMLTTRLRPEDEYAVTMLATAWVTWRKAQADVEVQGRVVMSGGTAIANPALSVANQAHTQILALARELGLTPAARKKLLRSTTKKKQKPDWLSSNGSRHTTARR